MELSKSIRECRDGVVNNPYQGKDKKVLFVCSMGILRSATASRIYGDRYNTRAAGTWDDALIPVTQQLIDWADEIVFMTVNHEYFVRHNFILDKNKSIILDIPDDYEHMHFKLVKAFEEQYEPISYEWKSIVREAA